MKPLAIFLTTTLLWTSTTIAQSFDKSIDKDSLLHAIVNDMPAEKRAKFLKLYNDGSAQSKEFLLFMAAMPSSSKKALISNVDANYDKIAYLRTQYAKLVPPNYEVLIEFNPENKLIDEQESIDLRITELKNKETKVLQDWRLPYNSNKLNDLLKIIQWDAGTLAIIKKLLLDAHCVSIENGEITTIGFARSGMGKYSYRWFEKDLTRDQIKNWNNGCSDIFYKRNIVLEYGGGAIGSQCFPD